MTVVDRDALPARPQARKEVPQGRHAHAVIPGGRLALEELFPGLTREIEGLGAPVGDAQSQVRWFQRSGRLVGRRPTCAGCTSGGRCSRTASGRG